MLLYLVFDLIYLTDVFFFFFFQAEDGIRDLTVTGVQTCALPICRGDFGQAGDARLLAARVIEQHAVADAHLVAHEIARLVIADAGPRSGVPRRGDRKSVV